MKSILTVFIGLIVLASALAGHNLKIVGGGDARPHEFPFIVSLFFKADRAHYCGGTIVSDLFILTAGHCIYEMELTDLKILAGKHNITAIEQTEQIRYPVKYIIHEEYVDPVTDTYSPDIGLIKLDKPLDFTGAIKPISLPKKNAIPRGRGTIIGWGYTFNKGPYTIIEPEILQKAIVPILPNDVCEKSWEDSVNYNIFFCTGPLDGRIDTCDADSGGPLVQDLAGSRTVIGIVSFGPRHCGTPKKAAFFTRISTYIDWINKNMK